MNGNEKVSHFLHSLTWEQIPDPVRQVSKRCLLDALGAIISGTSTRSSRITAEHAANAWPGMDASILLRGKRSTAAGAAFANAYAANGLDSDDGGKYTKGHPGAQLVPAALAVSQKYQKNGRQLLTGLVAGYEISLRTGRCWHHHQTTYQACGSWGSVGSAAVAAHLMGLEEHIIQHALGIAEYHAPNLPMMRDIANPAMVKHGTGWGALTGITAAELAANGFTGIPSLLGFDEYQHWIDDLGCHYILSERDGVRFKEFAGCRWGHAAMLAARRIVQENHIALDDIQLLKVEGFKETVLLGARPPSSIEDAQFSTGWPLVILLVDGEVGPRGYTEDRLQDARLLDLLGKIELVESESLTRLADLQRLGDPAGRYESNVTITCKNGSVYAGSAALAGPDDEVEQDNNWVEKKFRWLASSILPHDHLNAIVNLVWQLEDLDQCDPLFDLLR